MNWLLKMIGVNTDGAWGPADVQIGVATHQAEILSHQAEIQSHQAELLSHQAELLSHGVSLADLGVNIPGAVRQDGSLVGFENGFPHRQGFDPDLDF